MDFVIFGMGLGATLVVLGWFWRTLGPRFRYRPANDAVLSGEQMVERISWTRFCRSGGFVWVMGGCLLLFAALVSLLFHLSDHTGALVVLVAFGIVALGVIAWLWAYLHRFGLIGLVAPREPKPIATQPSAPAPARSAARPSIRRKQPQPSATASQVQGPPAPADLAAEPVLGPPLPESVTPKEAAAVTDRPAVTAEASDQETPPATAQIAAPPAASAVPAAESEEAKAPTVIGAERRAEEGIGAPAATTQAGSSQGVDEAPTAPADADQPADAVIGATPVSGEERSGTTKASAASSGGQAPAVDRGAGAGGEVAGRPDAVGANPRQAAGAARPAAERRFDSAAFRESIARQEAHLAQAAGNHAGAGQPTGQPAPEKHVSRRQAGAPAERETPQRRFPAPRGVEGVQWVRDDGSGRIPAGFPVKGDPATRLYYPATSELYEQAHARYFFASPREAEAAGYRQAAPPRRLVGGADRKHATSGTSASLSGATADTDLPLPAGVEGRDWVRADDTNSVPAGFPVKGNASSKLYHLAGSRFYDRTVAEFYFASPERAEAAGYQLPHSLRESSVAAVNRSPVSRPGQRAHTQHQAEQDTR